MGRVRPQTIKRRWVTFPRRLSYSLHGQTMPAWKHFELWVAKLLGSERNPLSGGNAKHSRSDSLHPHLFISCKHTRQGHKTLFRLIEEETAKALVEKKLPIVFIGRSGAGIGNKLDNTIAIVPVRYLAALLNSKPDITNECEHAHIKDDFCLDCGYRFFEGQHETET